MAADRLSVLREGREGKSVSRVLAAARTRVLVAAGERVPAAPGKGREVGGILG